MRGIFLTLGGAIFGSMLGVGIIAPIMPLYAESLKATGVWIGVIFAGFSISRAIFMPLIGRLSDQIAKRKAFLCTGLLAYALISLAYVHANSVLGLTVVRLLHGSAAGMILPIAQAYIGDISPEGQEGTWMGYFNSAFFTGFGFGFILGGVLTDHFGMNSAFYTMGGLNLLAFVFALLFLPEAQRHREAREDSKASLVEIMKSRAIKGLFSLRLANAMGKGAFVCFLPIFAAYYGMSPTQIGVLLAVNILAIAFLQAYCGRLADRFGRKRLVIIGSLLDALTLFFVPLTRSFSQLLGLCAFGGSGRALAIPASSALTVEEGRKYGMGSAMGVFTMAMSLGMAAGPIIGGLVMDSLGIIAVFLASALLGLVGTGLFSWFTR